MNRPLVAGVIASVLLLATPFGATALLLAAAANRAAAEPCSVASGPVGDGTVRLPLTGSYTVTSGFGPRVHPVTGELKAHQGLDLSMNPHGGPVVAMAAGVVRDAREAGAAGNMVVIDHGGGLVSRYLHLARWTVEPGQPVPIGAQIGVEGATGRVTGAHLHWEVWVDGVAVDPKEWAISHGLALDGQAPPAPSGSDPATGQGTRPAQGTPAISGWSAEQVANAAEVLAAARALGVDDWTATVAVMTAIGESDLINIDHGDAAGPDSRGLFQQRDNGAWGSYADRMTPRIATTNFLQALLAVPGYRDLAPTIAAHRTQRNADPMYYERFWPAAVALVSALGGSPPTGSGLVAGCAALGSPPGAPTDCPVTSSPAEPGLRPLSLAGLRCVSAAFPQISTMYGVGSRPGPSDHPAGNAVDFMIDEYRTPQGRALGWQVAEWVRAHHQVLGVTYVIFDSSIWTASRDDEGWRPYGTAYSSDDNRAHRNHVHVSFRSS